MVNLPHKNDCCGCTACESVCSHKAITMEPDNEGFLYPIVNESHCVECHLCEKTCPVLERDRQDETIEIKGQQYYALRSKDEDILYNSSSGGVFSVVANYVFNHSGVVVGAEYSDDMEVRHIIIKDTSELKKLRGSKYVQSNIQGIYPEIKGLLNQGVTVLFTGTPCQVHALKQFLRKPYENLITIDLICHATPSPKVFKEYINYLNEHYNEQVVWMNMRDKEKRGWGDPYSIRLQFSDNQQVVDDTTIVQWPRIYFSRLIDRPSCHHCRYTNFKREGDLTMADFLDLNKLRPDLYSKKGTSLLIINTLKGEKVFNDIDKGFDYWSVTHKEASQPCLNHPISKGVDREWFWEYYNKHSFNKALNLFFTDTILARIRRKISRYIHSIKK